MIPSPEHNDPPAAGKPLHGGKAVQIRLRARVCEADALEAEAPTQQAGVPLLESGCGAEVEADLTDGCGQSFLETRMRVAEETRGQLADQVNVPSVCFILDYKPLEDASRGDLLVPVFIV